MPTWIFEPGHTEAEFRALYRHLRSGLPWGAADRRGALNYLTPSRTLAAATQVRLGRSVSLAAPIENRTTPDNPHPAVHEMTGARFAHGELAQRIPQRLLEQGPEFLSDQLLFGIEPLDFFDDLSRGHISILSRRFRLKQ